MRRHIGTDEWFINVFHIHFHLGTRKRKRKKAGGRHKYNFSQKHFCIYNTWVVLVGLGSLRFINAMPNNCERSPTVLTHPPPHHALRHKNVLTRTTVIHQIQKVLYHFLCIRFSYCHCMVSRVVNGGKMVKIGMECLRIYINWRVECETQWQ